MAANYLLKPPKANKRPANIYANRSGLILHRLLSSDNHEFGVREIARELDLSTGLVQKVLSELAQSGIVEIEGIRTAKRYYLKKPRQLLLDWFANYSIVKKCRFWNYQSGYSPHEIEARLQGLKSAERDECPLALHSAARAHKCNFTNLNGIEIYCSNTQLRSKLEKLLRLEPVDRGYEVLLIEPYYSSILEKESSIIDGLSVSSPLHTLVDLYHFPLRGSEQAEYMVKTHKKLKPLADAI